MFSVDYQSRGVMTLDNSGRPTVPVTLVQRTGSKYRENRIRNILVDTGATITSLDKRVADLNGYPIIKHGEPILLGFNDFGKIIKALMKAGKTEAEVNAYLKSYAGRSKDLLASLHNEYSITNIGLVCDLRRVSFALLCGYIVNDVIIATPSEDDVAITEVIGMNILEKFSIGMDFENNWFYLSHKTSMSTIVNSDYACGDVSLLTT